MLIHGTGLMQAMREAETAEDMYSVLHKAEEDLLKTL
jgi:hypothetical protein